MRHRLPKGISISYLCEATTFEGEIIEVADTKSELLEIMSNRGYEREDFDIQWVAFDINNEGIRLDNEGIGETKEEARRDFWCNYKINK